MRVVVGDLQSDEGWALGAYLSPADVRFEPLVNALGTTQIASGPTRSERPPYAAGTVKSMTPSAQSASWTR